MKQTAVQWLIDQLSKNQYHNEIPKILEQAKQMEKQQIIEAAERWKGTDFAEQYYNETYGSKGSDDHVPDVVNMISFQTEISDEEVEKEIKKRYETTQNDAGFRDGCAWYREQLKSKSNH